MRSTVTSFLLMLVAVSASLCADLAGIWTGQAPGRRGVKEDLAFEFKLKGQAFTGTMFGDEFDLPVEELSITGDRIRFTVTSTNYFRRVQTKFVYSGTVKDDQMELTRERTLAPGETLRDGETTKQTFKIQRLAR